MRSTDISKKSTGLVLRTGMVWMLVAAFAAGSPAAAQDSTATTGAPTTTAGFELDVLPYVSGGYYISGWIGHDRLRLRPVVAKTNLPSFVVQDGFTNADLEAYAVIVDYFPRGGLRGFWVGAGVEYWKNSIENESNGGTAKWNNTVATIGAGYVWKVAGNFYLKFRGRQGTSWWGGRPVARSSANPAGRTPIRISMMSPIPFWPSFEPWAKLTPVQARTSSARTPSGGGRSVGAGACSSGLRNARRAARRASQATKKPRKGLTTSERSTWPAFAQLTPWPNPRRCPRTPRAPPRGPSR